MHSHAGAWERGELRREGLLANDIDGSALPLEQRFPITSGVGQADTIAQAEHLASERGYPPSLARLVRFKTTE